MASRAAAQLANVLMSYIALARKWRPRTFSQLVGQEHINKALINSLTLQRLHHAYLFTGTRGVGKTSIARLLAKALNCESGISAEPCLACEACVAIEQGRFIDLIEIDGASRTRVEDTREILENVQYAPTNGRFKIYLIDEVHMLSTHSFNALLKTLEEPPSHVKFLLATTDPQKLPVTVLSRCLQFNLKPMTPEIISQHLQFILTDETIPFETQALQLLAKAARGSMRDGLSLLDQAIAASDNHIRTQDIKAILGHTKQDYALQLLQALANLDPQRLIAICREIANEGGNFHYVLEETLCHLHQITVSQCISNSNPLITSEPELVSLSNLFTPEDVQLFYQIALKGIDEIHLAPTLAIGFEMTVLRMYTFKPAAQVTAPTLTYQAPDRMAPREIAPSVIIPNTLLDIALDNILDNASTTQIAKPSLDITENPIDRMEDSLPAESPVLAAPLVVHVVSEPLVSQPKVNEDWNSILTQLNLNALALTAAENAEFVSKTRGNINLRIAKGHQSVFTTTVVSRIEQALTNYYKEPVKLNLQSNEQVLSSPAQQKKVLQEMQHQNAEIALQNDPFFQQLQQEFSAELVKNSIVPVKDDL